MQASTSKTFDAGGYLPYVGAIPLQVSLMSGSLFLLQQLNTQLVPNASSLLPILESADIPKALVTLFFLVISIKSRIFCPLDATRPNIKTEKSAISDKKRPSWMPPPLTFPIVWSLIGLLRAASSVMVWEASGRDLLSLPLIMMCVHLAVGDAWNNVNVTKQELGMAVPGVWLGCLGSAIGVTAAYYQADLSAGLLLSPSVVWLTIASVLVTDIWRINVDANGDRMPLVPVK
jgi:benzodiazapine receptor